jgi:hypothetical protein
MSPVVVPPAPPDSVVTTPSALTARIELLAWSTTKSVPTESTASAYGLLKSALVPSPFCVPDSVPPRPPPASVVVAPVAATMTRTRLFDESAT